MGGTVRQRLQWMSLCLVIPAIAAMALLVAAQYGASRRQFESQLMASSRLLGVSVDRELENGRTLLGGLAMARSLQAGDLVAFDGAARFATRGRGGWIVLMDDQDRQLVNTLVPRGTALPWTAFPEAGWAELRKGRIRVSGLVTGPIARRPIIVIDRPVVLKGRLYVLSYVQRPAAFQSIFVPKLLPPSWIGVILDQNGHVIARSLAPQQSLGRSATPDFRRALRRTTEGTIKSKSLEGMPTIVGYTRSTSTGWTFMIAAPRREVQWAAVRSIRAALAAFAVLLVGGLLSARWFAQPISRDIGALADQARRLASDRRSVAPGGHLPETAAVREAMAAAAAGLAQREAERDAAEARQTVLINELNHRVKNSLATVQSLARHSFLAPEERRSLGAFEDRVVALSRAHNLLTENAWSGADLVRLVAATLAPYGDRSDWSGPSIALDPQPALSLSLVLHELATNAAKYGAFSAGGQVKVAWRVRPDGCRVELTWVESGGPPAKPPTREGFGSRLIRQSIERELRGVMTIEYPSEGLRCRFELPVSQTIRPVDAGPQAAKAVRAD